ncbi:MAG TPA: hypothetical protein VIH57_10550 [Bacteroidales bacterium]
MKKYLIAAFLIISIAGFAQSTGKETHVGISFGVGKSFIYEAPVFDGPAYTGLGSFDLGLEIHRQLRRTIFFETGVNWHHSKLKVSYANLPGNSTGPGNGQCNMLSIPSNVRFEIGDYFFINGGGLINIDITPNRIISSQTGLGMDIGLGVKLSVLHHFHVYINPYLNYYGLVLFNNEDIPQKLLDSGITIAIMR